MKNKMIKPADKYVPKAIIYDLGPGMLPSYPAHDTHVAALVNK